MKYYFQIMLLILVCGSTSTIESQVLPDSVKSCEKVRKWLRDSFYYGKRRQLSYVLARKKMYAFIDNYNDTITCAYGGFKVRHTYGFEDTDIYPLTCEHTIPSPQDWRYDEDYSDIHHLFPVLSNWNFTRKDHPFKDISDAATTKWMRLASSLSSIPNLFIDEYSESNGFQFEPREDHKGNVARAIFYYSTVYEWWGASGLNIVSDLATLKRWHEQDPPDARERERNRKIEIYQGNRNPYIDHPEWVYRAWFCTTTDLKDELNEQTIQIYPNPVLDNLNLDFNSNQSDEIRILIFNSLGQLVFSRKSVYENQSISLTHLQSSIYFLRIYKGGSILPIKTSSFIKF